MLDMSRRRGVAAVAVALCLAPLRASAEAPIAPPAFTSPAFTSMGCDGAAQSGRVVCWVEGEAAEGRSIVWGDVVVESVPEFALALKSRLGPSDVATRTPSRLRWVFGLVAKRTGRGVVRARVRLVVCGEARRCVPIEVPVEATLSVG